MRPRTATFFTSMSSAGGPRRGVVSRASSPRPAICHVQNDPAKLSAASRLREMICSLEAWFDPRTEPG